MVVLESCLQTHAGEALLLACGSSRRFPTSFFASGARVLFFFLFGSLLWYFLEFGVAEYKSRVFSAQFFRPCSSDGGKSKREPYALCSGGIASNCYLQYCAWQVYYSNSGAKC